MVWRAGHEDGRGDPGVVLHVGWSDEEVLKACVREACAHKVCVCMKDVFVCC